MTQQIVNVYVNETNGEKHFLCEKTPRNLAIANLNESFLLEGKVPSWVETITFYEDGDQPTEVYRAGDQVANTWKVPIVEAQEDDIIRVHVSYYPIVNGIVWAGTDREKAKAVFNHWTQNHQVGQASVEFRHLDKSGWSIQYNDPDLYYDRHDEMQKALQAGKPFTGTRD